MPGLHGQADEGNIKQPRCRETWQDGSIGRNSFHCNTLTKTTRRRPAESYSSNPRRTVIVQDMLIVISMSPSGPITCFSPLFWAQPRVGQWTDAAWRRSCMRIRKNVRAVAERRSARLLFPDASGRYKLPRLAPACHGGTRITSSTTGRPRCAVHALFFRALNGEVISCRSPKARHLLVSFPIARTGGAAAPRVPCIRHR